MFDKVLSLTLLKWVRLTIILEYTVHSFVGHLGGRGGGGEEFSHIFAIRACVTVQGMVFRSSSLENQNFLSRPGYKIFKNCLLKGAPILLGWELVWLCLDVCEVFLYSQS